MCFKTKDTLVDVPIGEKVLGEEMPVKVCKGCYYEIDKIKGFLEMHGAGLSLQDQKDQDEEGVVKGEKKKS